LAIDRILEVSGLTEIERPARGNRPARKFTISPKLLAGLKQFQSAAVALTGVDLRREMPHGLVVLHPGKDQLAQGIIETCLSAAAFTEFLQPGEAIGGYPSYASPFGVVVASRTLVIAGTRKDEVAAAIERFADPSRPSLAKTHAFEELVLAQTIADIQSFEWVVASVGTTKSGLAADFWLSLKEGNRSLPFQLARTAPVSKESLAAAPAGASAVLAIGRRGRDFMPGMGLVLTVADSSRSKALWNELLRIPATPRRDAAS